MVLPSKNDDWRVKIAHPSKVVRLRCYNTENHLANLISLAFEHFQSSFMVVAWSRDYLILTVTAPNRIVLIHFNLLQKTSREQLVTLVFRMKSVFHLMLNISVENSYRVKVTQVLVCYFQKNSYHVIWRILSALM